MTSIAQWLHLWLRDKGSNPPRSISFLEITEALWWQMPNSIGHSFRVFCWLPPIIALQLMSQEKCIINWSNYTYKTLLLHLYNFSYGFPYCRYLEYSFIDNSVVVKIIVFSRGYKCPEMFFCLSAVYSTFRIKGLYQYFYDFNLIWIVKLRSNIFFVEKSYWLSQTILVFK